VRGGTRVWSADHCCGGNRPGFGWLCAGEALNAEDAFAYHCEQAATLAVQNVDLLYAPTFPALPELCGVARAMAQTGRPYALAPMLHPDGTMLDGTPLAEAIASIDAGVFPTP
jgi:S-methylmethionine-dependent homocysteine/selenocysteine methylase